MRFYLNDRAEILLTELKALDNFKSSLLMLMKMELVANFKSKILTGAALIILATLFDINSPIKSEICEENPETFATSCFKTPVTYKTRVYELGFCTSDPLSGTNGTGINVTSNHEIDATSCFPTFSSDSGSLVDISTIGSVQNLIGRNIKPPMGTYEYVYMVVSNTFVLKGTQSVDGVPFYSSSNGTATKLLSEYVEWNNTVVDFEKGTQCEPIELNRMMAAAETYNTGITGTMKALLSHNVGDQVQATTPANCGISNRIFGSFEPTNPVIITESTKGLEVVFSIENTGLSVVPWSGPDDSEVGYFSTGPILPSFQTF